jgi:hypothetical protein
MDEKLVVVAQYESAEIAHLDRAALGAAGVEAVIENENLAAAGLYYPLAACGVKLLVRQSDLEQARRILQEIQSSGPAVDEAGNPPFDEEDS